MDIRHWKKKKGSCMMCVHKKLKHPNGSIRIKDGTGIIQHIKNPALGQWQVIQSHIM